MDPWQFIAERKIQEAMSEGKFENLDGTGQPIPIEDLPFTDPSLWMAHHIMKNNGLAPAWVVEGNEIEADIQQLRQRQATACATSRHLLRDEVDRLNRRIAAFNLKAPAACYKPYVE
jgi:hypothetical protein